MRKSGKNSAKSGGGGCASSRPLVPLPFRCFLFDRAISVFSERFFNRKKKNDDKRCMFYRNTLNVHACAELELRVHVCCSQFSRNPPYRKRVSLFRTVMEGHSQKDSRGVFTESCALTVQEVSLLCFCPLRGLQLTERKQLKLDASIIC